MNIAHPDIVVRHIKTKNKTRKITTYRSEDCDLKIKHKKINSFIKFIGLLGYKIKGKYDEVTPKDMQKIFQDVLNRIEKDYADKDKIKIEEISKYYMNSVIKKYLNIDTSNYIKLNFVNNN